MPSSENIASLFLLVASCLHLALSLKCHTNYDHDHIHDNSMDHGGHDHHEHTDHTLGDHDHNENGGHDHAHDHEHKGVETCQKGQTLCAYATVKGARVGRGCAQAGGRKAQGSCDGSLCFCAGDLCNSGQRIATMTTTAATTIIITFLAKVLL